MAAVVPPLTWCWIAIEQIDRLHRARQAVVEVRHGGTLAGRQRFWSMRAETHFVLVATSKFRSLLEDAGPVDERFTRILEQFPVKITHLRNALEHEDGFGRWAKDYGTDYDAQQWSQDGSGIIGEAISDAALRAALDEAYTELLAIEQERP